MATRADITPELCRQLLRYEPETGKLFWKERPASMYQDSACNGGTRTAQWAADAWNSKYAGREAFTSKSESGYHVGAILNITHSAHRVAWAISTGEWPADQIDHIDGDRANNRICNLRSVSNAVNHKNEGKPRNNTSGHVGVTWDKQTLKWMAQIKVNYKNVKLGRFLRIEDAIAARRMAEVEYGFAEGHGKRPAHD